MSTKQNLVIAGLNMSAQEFDLLTPKQVAPHLPLELEGSELLKVVQLRSKGQVFVGRVTAYRDEERGQEYLPGGSLISKRPNPNNEPLLLGYPESSFIEICTEIFLATGLSAEQIANGFNTHVLLDQEREDETV